ncbi:uncharacterized protein LOC120159294 [Hibiscus syriacus]|uniref:uncharacterized protein LOC120159294 n=1 Tax=Hibiscus syriacus TaxID=106335 RepID=UPI001921EBD3|nr:uncharacterized protein LOC120159294 [Hibiscus syriacus]
MGFDAVNACSVVSCVQGTCRETNGALLDFECDCYPDWTKLKMGPIELPTCIILNSCTLTWCGYESCKTNDSGYQCDCNDGSEKFHHMPALPCYKPCAVGPDCDGVGLGERPTPAPQPALSSHDAASKGSSTPKC